MQKGKGRFFNRPTISKRKKYDKFFIYIPTEVARDTNFPLKDGDRVEVEVEIKDETLIIKKAKS
jgi:bifunctional DNA-binding transcriptional regulator/antitoxin component of YhaV-PrlF toxin-antitoxin module